MNSIKKYVNGLGRTARTVLLGLGVIFVSAGIAQAATTISTNIQTDGTLSATGLASFGNASTTGSVSIAGNFMVNGNATTTRAGALSLVGPITVSNPAATSTITVGCVITTATSSATPVKLMFNTQATTSINGGTVQGVVVWGYGSTCP